MEYHFIGTHRTTDHSKSVQAVVEAAHYLLSQRKADYGWNEFTPRALIALAFAEKYLPISEKEKSLMMKRLDLQLFNLLKDGVENLATLALHINALYAMCEDPQDFHGIDLVEILRSKTDKAMESDFNLPAVFLTLCLANYSRSGDFDRLLAMYDDKRNDKIGVKALIMIALFACSRHETGYSLYERDFKMNSFVTEYNNMNKDIDVYSKTLICQALNARGYETSIQRNELRSHQLKDGSFVDLFGSYSAIPALMNTSLSDLQCKSRKYIVKSTNRAFFPSDEIFKPERQIEFSLWIPNGENAGYHTLQITFEGEKSFFDVMKMAEFRNPIYRFKYDESRSGKKIYYLAGIPNDAEKGLTWTLYKIIPDSIVKNSSVKKPKETEVLGVDQIFPRDGEHYMFQLEDGKM